MALDGMARYDGPGCLPSGKKLLKATFVVGSNFNRFLTKKNKKTLKTICRRV